MRPSWGSKEVQERSKRGRAMVSELRFFISAFLEDVPNENTIFAGPEGAQGGPKSLQSLPAQVRNVFQTPLDSRIDFWAFISALASSHGRSTPFRRTGPPPPQEQGFRPLLHQRCKKTMSFCTFWKTSILTPRTTFFFFVFFISVTGAETRPDSRGLRHSADPFGSGT